jgi:hypothetical protein
MNDDTEASLRHKIKQLNHVIAAATGRLDVVDQYIEKAEANGKPVDYDFSYFVRKSRKSLDNMMDRLAAGEDVVQ